MRVALAQLDATLGDVAANEGRVRETLATATDGGADLVVFPELYLSGYALAGTADDTARTPEQVAALVPPGAAALVGFHERDHSSAVYAEAGGVVHVQRKLYLVDYAPFHEDELFRPGGELRAFDTPLGRLAVLICNDAWQPALPFIAVHDGARILLMPACSSTAVPEAETYWRDLTRFYARMLQCYVVFVNRVGTEPGLTFWGGSHVVDPLGEVQAEAPRLSETILFAEVDVSLVEMERRRLPLLGDPRFELVRSELERLDAKGRVDALQYGNPGGKTERLFAKRPDDAAPNFSPGGRSG
jgi:predicted amidohydrolase